MKKVNFNAMQSFEVPESWIENAVNAKPQKKPIYLRPYVIGSAASVVLAVAVTIIAVIAMNKTPISPDSMIPVKPQTTTAATEATEATAAPTTVKPTEKATEPVTEAVTEPVTEPVTEAVTEEVTEPRELADDERLLTPDWYVWNVEGMSRSDAASGDIDPPVLKLDEMYQGTITVKMAADSPYGADDVLRCTVTAGFTDLNADTAGSVIVKLQSDDNGQKSVAFCPYESNAYLPSGRAYTFTFTGKTADGKEVTKTVTQTLSGDHSVTITI